MNRAEYRNRDALNQALDLYLGAMFLFVSECLDEQSIREFLRLLSDDDLRNEMEVKDIADLIKRYWSKSFKEKFKITDRYGMTRYYDARSVTSLIVEGRNRVSHQRLQELDPEFTRAQLFLIAEVLGQINMSVQQREVVDIRDKLFNDTGDHLVKIAVKAEKAKYEKSITKVEKRLAGEKENNEELSKQIADNTAKLDEKTEKLEKLSGRLVTAKLDEKESEKRLNSISKQLEKVQAEHSACEKHITTISDQVTSTEAARDDYKERLETASEELKEVNERLSITSGQLLAVKAEMDVSEERLATARKLLTITTIGNQEVRAIFPPFETNSTVRILDRRGVDKQDYLLGLLVQKQPTLIYVQSEEMIDNLLALVGPEKAAVIGRHDKQTSEAEAAEILKKLERKKLIAVVSNTTLSTLSPSHSVEHFVFCHLVPGLDEFVERCQPAFTSAKNVYLHLIYESKQNVEDLTEKYPNEEALRKLYQKFRNCTAIEEKFINLENLYSELCKDNELGMTKLGIETGFSIFRELGFLEQNEEGIRRLSTNPRKLEESKIYSRGEKLKKEITNSPAFQYEHSIEQIWEGILEKLNIDSEEILRENSIYKMNSRYSEIESDTRSSTVIEQDRTTPPPIPDVWPQRSMSAFNTLRQSASKNLTSANMALSTVNESNFVDNDFGGGSLAYGGLEEAEDYRNKYDLATQFAQEHGVRALEDGVAQLVEDRDNLDYDFTEDETNMLRAFQDVLRDFRTQSERSTERVENDSAASDEIAEAHDIPKSSRANAKVTEEQIPLRETRREVPKSTRTKSRKKKSSIAERYVAETTVEDRDSIAAKVVELRINASGSRPLSWRKIREKLGLKEDQFHKVIRPSEGYREAVIQRIKSLKAREGGWEYNGKLEVLTGIELTEKELA